MFKITRILVLTTLFSMMCGVCSSIVQAGVVSPLNQGIGLTFPSFISATKFHFVWLLLLCFVFALVYFYPKMKEAGTSTRNFFQKKKRDKHYKFIDDNILEIDSYIKSKKKAKTDETLEENQMISKTGND